MISELSRRAMMTRVLQGMGALSAGVFAKAQEHSHSAMSTADEAVPSADWTPRFFDASQNETMVALSERLLPGSKEALCNRLIDLVLPIESEKNRIELMRALSAFDAEAKRRYGKTFHESTPEHQDEILSIAAQHDGKLHAEFALAKEWTADAYWSSLKGLRELGWTGRVAWERFPDCHDIHPGV